MTLATAFPDDIARGAVGGHGHFSTQVVVSHGGHAVTNQNWQDARGEWNVSQGVKLTGQYELARNHFYMARGQARNFLFKDWADYKVARAEGSLVLITSTTFQISKVYGDDAPNEYVRPIKRPDTGTVQIWRNSVLQTITTHYTVNVDTGVVTFLSAPGGDTIEVACSFKVLCRYRVDAHKARLMFRRSESQSVLEWDDIDIVEEREA